MHSNVLDLDHPVVGPRPPALFRTAEGNAALRHFAFDAAFSFSCIFTARPCHTDDIARGVARPLRSLAVFRANQHTARAQQLSSSKMTTGRWGSRFAGRASNSSHRHPEWTAAGHEASASCSHAIWSSGARVGPPAVGLGFGKSARLGSGRRYLKAWQARIREEERSVIGLPLSIHHT